MAPTRTRSRKIQIEETPDKVIIKTEVVDYSYEQFYSSAVIKSEDIDPGLCVVKEEPEDSEQTGFISEIKTEEESFVFREALRIELGGRKKKKGSDSTEHSNDRGIHETSATTDHNQSNSTVSSNSDATVTSLRQNSDSSLQQNHVQTQVSSNPNQHQFTEKNHENYSLRTTKKRQLREKDDSYKGERKKKKNSGSDTTQSTTDSGTDNSITSEKRISQSSCRISLVPTDVLTRSPSKNQESKRTNNESYSLRTTKKVLANEKEISSKGIELGGRKTKKGSDSPVGSTDSGIDESSTIPNHTNCSSDPTSESVVTPLRQSSDSPIQLNHLKTQVFNSLNKDLFKGKTNDNYSLRTTKKRLLTEKEDDSCKEIELGSRRKKKGSDSPAGSTDSGIDESSTGVNHTNDSTVRSNSFSTVTTVRQNSDSSLQSNHLQVEKLTNNLKKNHDSKDKKSEDYPLRTANKMLSKKKEVAHKEMELGSRRKKKGSDSSILSIDSGIDESNASMNLTNDFTLSSNSNPTVTTLRQNSGFSTKLNNLLTEKMPNNLNKIHNLKNEKSENYSLRTKTPPKKLPSKEKGDSHKGIEKKKKGLSSPIDTTANTVSSEVQRKSAELMLSNHKEDETLKITGNKNNELEVDDNFNVSNNNSLATVDNSDEAQENEGETIKGCILHVKNIDIQKIIKEVCSISQLKRRVDMLIPKHLQFPVGQYKCYSCNTDFKLLAEWKLHIILYLKHMACFPQPFETPRFKMFNGQWSTTKDGRYSCDQCYFVTKHRQDVFQHIFARHKKQDLKCAICPKIFNTLAYLKNHLSYMHDPMKARLYCSHCDYHTIDRNSLKLHMRYRHTKEGYLKCDLCEHLFPSNFKLKQHKAEKHSKDHVKKIHNCPDCSYVSFQAYNVKNHYLRKHVKDISYTCHHCSYKTTAKLYLLTHIQKFHIKDDLDNKKYTCNKCEKKFPTSSGLQSHLRYVHSNEPNNVMCKSCDKIFPTNLDCLIHENVSHLSRAEFHCNDCSHIAKAKSELLDHINKKHKVVYYCASCPFKCFMKSRILSHWTNRHDPKAKKFKCAKCEYKAKTATLLKQHFNIKHHPNPVTFSCFHCGHVNKVKHKLSQHMQAKHSDLLKKTFKKKDNK